MKNRFHLDPEENRRSLMTIVYVIIAVLVLCGLGVYFGLFVGFRLAGAGG